MENESLLTHRTLEFDTIATWLSIVWVVTFLRVYARACILKSFGMDDIFQLLAVGVFTIASVCIMYALDACDPAVTGIEKAIEIGNLVVSVSNMYVATSALIKVSLAFFYLRFLKDSWQRWSIIATTIYYMLLSIAMVILTCEYCGPLDLWIINAEFHTCKLSWGVMEPLNYLYACSNTASNLLFSIMPMFSIWRTQMYRRDKICSSILIGMGCVSCICSVARFVYIDSLNTDKQSLPSSSLALWSTWEIGLDQLAMCLATLRPLLRKIRAAATTKTTLAPVTPDLSSMASPGLKHIRRKIDVDVEVQTDTADDQWELGVLERPGAYDIRISRMSFGWPETADGHGHGHVTTRKRSSVLAAALGWWVTWAEESAEDLESASNDRSTINDRSASNDRSTINDRSASNDRV